MSPTPRKKPSDTETAPKRGGETPEPAATRHDPETGSQTHESDAEGACYPVVDDPCKDDPCNYDPCDYDPDQFKARPRSCIEPARRCTYKPLPDVATLGIDKANMLTCSELVYIHHFAVAFEAVDVLLDAYGDGSIPLECEVGARVDEYIACKPRFVTHEERSALTSRVVAGVAPIVDDLYKALMELYRLSCICGDDDRHSLPAPLAGVLWYIENAQRELSRLGAGIGGSVALRSGRQLGRCFMILNSPDLPSFIGISYDEGMPGVIDRLLSMRKHDGPPKMAAYRHAKLAVASRNAIQTLACLDELSDLSLPDLDLDRLAAQLALLFAVSGRDEIRRQEQLGDEGAQRGAELLRLTRRNMRSNPFGA